MKRCGCEKCWPDDAAAAWDARGQLKGLETIIDDAHLIVRRLACEACGQTFVSIMTETIDWVDGEDPQHWVSMPLTPDESARLVAAGEDGFHTALGGLERGRRALHHDAPKGSAAMSDWGRGISIARHD